MPLYLQASILSVRDPILRGRLMDDQDLAETYYQYGQVTHQLRVVDPENLLLVQTIHSLDWLPTEDDVAELQSALNSTKEQSPGLAYYDTTQPVVVSGRRAIDASRAYEEGIRDLYGNQSLKPRKFPVITENGEAIKIADEVVTIDGLDTAIEAKYVADWSLSLRNPASPMGQQSWAIEEQQKMLDQAKIYSNNFDGGVIYHTNSRDLAKHYTQIFQNIEGMHFKFIITPAK